MEFLATDKAKKKARMRRIRKEKKWLPFRLIYLLSFIVSIASFMSGIFLPTDAYLENFISSVLFAVSLVIGVIAMCFVYSMTRHWIQERYNERLWIDDEHLCHFYQTPWGTGWNSRSLDDTGDMYIMDLNSIKSARYDEKTRRVEFFVTGKGKHLISLSSWKSDYEWELREGYSFETYDYFEPSLVTALEQRGIPVSREHIDFKMFDNVFIGDPEAHGLHDIG